MNQNTPLVVDGVLYTTTSMNIVAYWSDSEEARILYGTGSKKLFSLEAKTSRPDPDFGAGGHVDLGEGVGLGDDIRQWYGVTLPPFVCRDVVAVGAATYDFIHQPPTDSTAQGDLRGFGVRTGELRWTFRTIPHEGEFGYDTWDSDTHRRFWWRQCLVDHERRS